MTRKLTDEELTSMETPGRVPFGLILERAPLMATELRSLRTAPVISEEERDNLEWLAQSIRNGIVGMNPHAHHAVSILGFLDRLLSAGKETL